MNNLFPLILILYPFLELYLLIAIGAEIGAGVTLLWIILSALIGIGVIRLHGAALFAVLNTLAHRTPQEARGRVFVQITTILAPSLGGLCLIIPGFLSDAVGIALILLGLPRLMVALAQTRHAPTDAPEILVIEGVSIDLKSGREIRERGVIDVPYEEVEEDDPERLNR